MRLSWIVAAWGAFMLAGPVARAESSGPAAAPDAARAADLEGRTTRARKQLGAKAPVVVVDDAFVLAAPPGHDAALRSSVAFTRDVLAALVNGRFRSLPKAPVSVMLFFDRDRYEAYCKSALGEACISRFGFFRPDLRAIIMNAGPGLGTLSHELVHPLYELDFKDGPTWLNEGIASLYEAPALAKRGEIRGVTNWRHPRLAAALRSKTEREHARLDVLFGMSDDTFRGDREDLNYALARYACQWLESQGKLWEFYARYRDGFAADKTGEKAFREVVGKTPKESHGDFQKWALALKRS